MLEKLNPGAMLSELEDDEEATHIAAEVMKRIWRPLEFGQLAVCAGASFRTPKVYSLNRLVRWIEEDYVPCSTAGQVR